MSMADLRADGAFRRGGGTEGMLSGILRSQCGENDEDSIHAGSVPKLWRRLIESIHPLVPSELRIGSRIVQLDGWRLSWDVITGS